MLHEIHGWPCPTFIAYNRTTQFERKVTPVISPLFVFLSYLCELRLLKVFTHAHHPRMHACARARALTHAHQSTHRHTQHNYNKPLQHNMCRLYYGSGRHYNMYRIQFVPWKLFSFLKTSCKKTKKTRKTWTNQQRNYICLAPIVSEKKKKIPAFYIYFTMSISVKKIFFSIGSWHWHIIWKRKQLIKSASDVSVWRSQHESQHD